MGMISAKNSASALSVAACALAAVGVLRGAGRARKRIGGRVLNGGLCSGMPRAAATGSYPQGRFAEDKHLRGLAYRIVFVTLRPSAVAQQDRAP